MPRLQTDAASPRRLARDTPPERSERLPSPQTPPRAAPRALRRAVGVLVIVGVAELLFYLTVGRSATLGDLYPTPALAGAVAGALVAARRLRGRAPRERRGATGRRRTR